MKKFIFIAVCMLIAAPLTMHSHKGTVPHIENILLRDTYAAEAPSADPLVILNSLDITEGAFDIDGKVCNNGNRDFVPPEETGAVIKIELKDDPAVQSDPNTVTLNYHEVKELKANDCVSFTGNYRIDDFITADKSAPDENCKETVDKYLVFSIVPVDPCNVFFPVGQDADSKNNKIVKNITMNIKCSGEKVSSVSP